jgi:hypothetical protein
MKKLKPSVKVA